MITEELIKNYFLTKSKTIKAYIFGNEDKLFLTDDHDHIKNTFKSNKKETRMMFYRFNYFIAVITSFIILSQLNDFQNFLSLLGNSILLFPLFLKPLVHLFAIKNKRNKKNISLYKQLYGEGNFNKLTITSEIQNKKEKGVSKGLIIGIIFVAAVILFLSFRSTHMSTIEKIKATKQDIKPERKEIVKINSKSTNEKENINLIKTKKTKKAELKKNKLALITGTDIIMRSEHSTKSKIVGSFKEAGEKITLLDTYTSKKQTILIKNEVIVNDRKGQGNILSKGKSVKIISINEEPPVEILISFITKNGETKEGVVPENALDYINESWYKVKRDNGEIGWVFGKFIKMINK